jgi:hypothetical protein
LLGFEAQRVIALRIIAMAAGGSRAQAEAHRARLGAKVGGPEATEPAKFIETAEK